jgi:hypothetical protein
MTGERVVLDLLGVLVLFVPVMGASVVALGIVRKLGR